LDIKAEPNELLAVIFPAQHSIIYALDIDTKTNRLLKVIFPNQQNVREKTVGRGKQMLLTWEQEWFRNCWL
jgi:hypothetical protein